MASVNNNLIEAIPHDEALDVLQHEATRELVTSLLDKGWLGNKSGQGFYKRTKVNGKTEFWVLDPATMDYRGSD